MNGNNTFAGLKCGPSSLRSKVATAQYVAFDKGFYGEEHKYQNGSLNYQAYELGQEERRFVEEYSDELIAKGALS